MKEGDIFRKVVFLDTNMLHFVGIYLEYAKTRHLFPWDPVELPTGKQAALQDIEAVQEADGKRSLKRGLETLYFLLTRDFEVQYSAMSELELLTTRTKGAAIISTAREGIPDRIWSHFREEEIRERVPLATMDEIKKKIDGLAAMMEESGVAVTTFSTEQAKYALELAKCINGLVYIEAMDSIIYASALLAQADYLFTTDGYLKDTVNFIHTPKEPRYSEIRRRLQELVTPFMLGTPDDIQLPSAHSITASGKPKPDLLVSQADRRS